jgi:hypothetical protein
MIKSTGFTLEAKCPECTNYINVSGFKLDVNCFKCGRQINVKRFFQYGISELLGCPFKFLKNYFTVFFAGNFSDDEGNFFIDFS